METLNAILKEDPPSLFESTPNVSPALERIVRRCLEKRPEERFRTAHDLGIALDAISTASTRSLSAETIAATDRQPAATGAFSRGRASCSRAPPWPSGACWPGNGRTRGSRTDGGGPRQLTRDGGNAENPTATPDGRWSVYSSGNPQKAGLWKIHPDGTGATQMVKGRVSLPDTSPDGRHVVYRVFSGKYPAILRVVRLEDGQAEPFEIAVDAKRQTTVTLGRVRWMPDGKAIAFVGQDEDGASGIYVLTGR